jgi:hypothetical protein
MQLTQHSYCWTEGLIFRHDALQAGVTTLLAASSKTWEINRTVGSVATRHYITVLITMLIMLLAPS